MQISRTSGALLSFAVSAAAPCSQVRAAVSTGSVLSIDPRVCRALPTTTLVSTLAAYRPPTSGRPNFFRHISSAIRSRNQTMAANILARLPASFEKARESGDLFFFPSTIQTFEDPSGLEVCTDFISYMVFSDPCVNSPTQFQIRVCPALQKKPTLPVAHFEPEHDGEAKPEGKSDPFKPPYNPNLFLGEVQTEGKEYVVLVRLLTRFLGAKDGNSSTFSAEQILSYS